MSPGCPRSTEGPDPPSSRIGCFVVSICIFTIWGVRPALGLRLSSRNHDEGRLAYPGSTLRGYSSELCAPVSEDFADSARRLFWVLVLPNPDGQPARLHQASIGVCVSCTICIDLGLPPSSIRFRPCPMNGAAMPEASVQKYGNSGRTENQVCLAIHLGEWPPIDSVAQPQRMQNSAQGQLRSRVTDSLSLKPTANGFR